MRCALPSMILVSALAGCGGGSDAPDARVIGVDAPAGVDGPADAPASDADTRLACLGDPAPGATGPIAIDGRVFEIVAYQAVPLAGADVELRRIADDTLIDAGVSDGDGNFALDGTAPLDAYLVVEATGRVASYAYVESDAIWAGQDVLVFAATAAELATWYADAGAPLTAGSRTVLAAIRDCDFHEAEGATLAVQPAAPVVYYDEAAMQWDPGLASASNGFVLVPNAPAALDLEPSLAAQSFPAEAVTARDGAITLVVVTPLD